MGMDMNFKFRQIGLIKTPYKYNAPYQSVDGDKGDFRIIVFSEYKEGLLDLDKFTYIYAVYYIDRLKKKASMMTTPPWTGGKKVGLFASRSPVRPNPIGISVVRVMQIINNEIIISGIDAFNNTALLDIKPYVRELDSRDDANYGWIDSLKGDKEHLLMHIKGVPHEY